MKVQGRKGQSGTDQSMTDQFVKDQSTKDESMKNRTSTSFLAFADLCRRVEETPGSLQKTEMVAAFLADLDESELSIACNFLIGSPFPKALTLDLGVGPSILYEAMAKACGCGEKKVLEMLRATGDPGLVASAMVERRRPIGFAAFLGAGRLEEKGGAPEKAGTAEETGAREGAGEAAREGAKAASESRALSASRSERAGGSFGLSLTEVYERFLLIARASGRRSQDARIKNLQYLFSTAGPLEARYIARLAIEDMRIGVGEGVLRDSIARAFASSGADAGLVERAHNLTNDIGLVARAAKTGGLASLSVMINHPIKMMLAQLGVSISSSLGEIGDAAVEWKYDGARVQIHKDGQRIRIFSRRLEDVTASLPDIVSEARRIRAETAILDGEAVAMGGDGRPLPFQEILKRFRRKHNVQKLASEIPLRIFLFDLILLEGRGLVDLPLCERRALLEGVAPADLLADQRLSADVEAVEGIYRAALEAGHEGLILKSPSSVYAPGKRGKNWLKIKPVMETLDLIVIGAKWGEGRRASLLGSYRLACLDQASGRLLDVGWVATGINDETLTELTGIFQELIVLEKGMELEIKPAVIFEVAYEEIQKSSSYNSGFALRFPRLVRVRDDKSEEEADGLERIAALYRGQRGRGNSGIA